MHDVVADDDGDGGGGERPGAVTVGTRWGGGKLGAPPYLPPPLQLWGADRRRWGYVLGTSGVWRVGGCGGSFHPGAPMVRGEVRGLGWMGGDGEASDEWVWRGGHADASLAGCVCAGQE